MRSRLSAAVGECVDLNVQFYQDGQPTDPYALRAIRIYKCSVNEENLVLEINMPLPTDEDRCPNFCNNEYIYGGLIKRCNDTAVDGLCGTDVESQYTPGCFIHSLKLCKELFDSGVYYDVWCFVGDHSDLCDDCETGACEDVTCTDVTSTDYDDETKWTCICNKFFVSDSNWYGDDGLSNIQLGFEPLDSRYNQPEKRKLSVGLTPLPLYSYNRAAIDPIIPMLNATITFQTAYCETIIDDEPMTIGLRSGSYRSNPYTLQYLLDTNRFLKGTYKYQVTVHLPNGETRVSPYFTVAIR